MSEIPPIRPSDTTLPINGKRRIEEPVSPVASRDPDIAEFSPRATVLAKLADLPPREDLVASIREQIADGSYDTDARFDAALDSLLGDVDEGLI